jgi:hypothetical protein
MNDPFIYLCIYLLYSLGCTVLCLWINSLSWTNFTCIAPLPKTLPQSHLGWEAKEKFFWVVQDGRRWRHRGCTTKKLRLSSKPPSCTYDTRTIEVELSTIVLVATTRQHAVQPQYRSAWLWLGICNHQRIPQAKLSNTLSWNNRQTSKDVVNICRILSFADCAAW